MADFEAPPGPPPPKVPEGWIVKWNEQYKEWFYVNSYTKKSQWEKPTEPARRPDDDGGPDGPPPSYTPGKNPTPASDTKSAAGSTNPFDSHAAGASSASSREREEEDARLARQLQEEENARAHSPAGSGAAASYASTPVPGGGAAGPYGDPQLPPRPDDRSGGGSRGLLGKLFGKGKTSQGYGGGYPGQQPYGGGGYGPQPAYGGGYPPQGYGGPGYGGYGPGPGYGGPPPGGYYGGGGYPQQQQSRPGGGMGGMGMGLAGGAALGLGTGLVGGMLLENAIDHHDQQVYNQGYENGDMGDGGGGDYGGDGGGDFGGGGDF